MGSKDSQNRMAIAVADVQGVAVDTQPYFCLNKYSGDLLLSSDGSFMKSGNQSSAVIMEQLSA